MLSALRLMDSGLDNGGEIPVLDHLVYATPDLEASVRYIGDTLGVTPALGGSHPGRGTRNYLLGLTGGSYLELIGRDPEQKDCTGELPFSLDRLEAAKLVGWALRVRDIDPFVDRVRANGYEPGPVAAMSRRAPDGTALHWKLTRPPVTDSSSLIPFLIDWGSSAHPSQTALQGARLVDFHVEGPEPERTARVLDLIGFPTRVEHAAQLRLVATVSGPSGSLAMS